MLEQAHGYFGGSERLALAHFTQMKNMNVDVELFYSGPLSPEWSSRVQGHSIKTLPKSLPRNFREANWLFTFLRELAGFDRILIHHHIEPFLALYVTRLYGKKTVWYAGAPLEFAWEDFITGLDYRSLSTTVFRTSEKFYGRAFTSLVLSDFLFRTSVRVARTADIQTLNSCMKILANSRFTSKFVSEAYGLKRPPVVVYPGTDPILEELASRYDSRDDNYALIVGPLIPRKNFETAIAAAAYAPSASVVAVGDGQGRKALVDLAEQRKLSFRIESSLSEKRLAELYSTCAFLANMSLFETFGLAVLEAGLFGKPCLVPDRGGPSEIVINGETGYLVNPKDLRSVSEKMKQLFENRSLRHDMGKRARQRILRDFTIEKSTRNLLKEIEV
jgi:glycosyltransferase involved in cell wall biosynthesis